MHVVLKKHANANEYVVCGVSRWKSSDVHFIDEFNKSSKKKKILAKVLRYFPLKPRLQGYTCHLRQLLT